MDFNEAKAAFQSDAARMASLGVIALDSAQSYIPDDWRRDFTMAMDAIPTLSTVGSSGIPAMLTTMVDPTAVRIAFAPTKAVEIFGEAKKGTWLDETVMFPVIEHTGEVSSYGDHANNGRTGANTNWPQRQNYLFQTIKEYGDRELERAGLARLNWVSEIDQAAATVMARFLNKTYFYGVAGLQNYGLLNDPSLTSALTPGTKAAGNSNVWIFNGAYNATANEVYSDVQALFAQLVKQTGGLIEATDRMVLAMSPTSATALLVTNSFGISVQDLLKKNFPNLRCETAVQYGVTSTSNPEGQSGGNLVQLIAESIDGQDTGYCSFSEKMRSHQPVRDLSMTKQKVTGGTWGCVVRMPIAIAQMLGV